MCISFFCLFVIFFFFFKQKTAYEMRISDWSSDVCSSDLWPQVYACLPARQTQGLGNTHIIIKHDTSAAGQPIEALCHAQPVLQVIMRINWCIIFRERTGRMHPGRITAACPYIGPDPLEPRLLDGRTNIIKQHARSEEHTSELQSLMRISYAVFCLK